MTSAERLLFSRVQRRAADLSPELRAAILKAFQRVRDSMTEAQIVRALSLGGEERLFQEVLTNAVLDVAMQPVRDRTRYGLYDAVKYFQKDIPVPPSMRTLGLSFDFLNPRVLDAIRALETRVITALAEAIRDTVREVVQLGLEQGLGPWAIAPLLRSSVGLAPNMVREIQNYRDALNGVNGRSVTDYTLRDKRFTKAPTTPEQVDRMVEAYTKRRIAQHAETVARTAALQAMKAGQRQSWEDAIGQGIVDRGRLRHKWIGVMDRRERPEHIAMENESQPFDAPYTNGEMVPGESTYNCRCLDRFYLL